MSNYMNEAFEALKILNEDTFEIGMDGNAELKDFMDNDIHDELELIIDPLAETEEELEDSYIGKAILDCVICQSKIYKDPSEVIIDENAGLANVGETCPYCQSVDGFKVIGQVAEFCKDCEEHEEEHGEDAEIETSEEEIKVDETEEEKIEESLKESTERDDIDADADDKKEKVEAEKEKIDDDADADRDYKLKKDDLKESDKSAAISIEDAQKWVDYDMKKYGKISGRTDRLIKKAGFQILKDDHGDYEVAAGKFESCNEDFEKVDIETDREKMSMTADENGKVTVTTEPKEEIKEDEEVIEPVSDEIKAEFKTTEEDESEEDRYADIDIDEFDEEEFDSLGEQYLKRVYENVKSFKTTKGSVNGNTLKLEGLITFKSGKVGKTNFVFEAKSVTKTGKLKFIGENKQFAKGKKSFTLTGKMNGNKLITESLTYNYRGKDGKSGESKRLYGTINK